LLTRRTLVSSPYFALLKKWRRGFSACAYLPLFTGSMAAPKILIVDDERAIRRSLQEILEMEGFAVEEAVDGADAIQKIKDGAHDLILCDIKMPKADGLEVLAAAKEARPDVPFILISGHGTIETAVDAVKNGAFDYIAKPPDLNRLLITVRNAVERGSLVTETKQLRQKVSRRAGGSAMIGQSEALGKIRDTIAKVAPTDARVLITGENGVGKELVARQIHEGSARKDAPLIEVNCAAIPAELIESELFGHEKGSFTSAVKQRIGKFEQASGGTLFLDEIGDMSLSAQAKVLRALQEGKITRVGGEKEIKVDVRVLAATNKDLMKESDEKNFRLDLYHRLSVIRIHVPPLRERLDDIPLLVRQFLSDIGTDYNQPAKGVDDAAIDELKAHNWTGNIRELRNAVERLVILGGKTISAEDVRAFV
jgi:two-component system nitrogen regulation response regulator NtrX